MEKIEEMREQIKDQMLGKGGAGGGAGAGDAGGEDGGEPEDEPIVEDLTVFVEDRPITPRHYESETFDETSEQVGNLTVRAECLLCQELCVGV